MTIEDGNKQLWFQLHTVYEKREAANITDLVMEQITGWKKIERFLKKKELLTDVQMKTLGDYTLQLLQHRPVQYVLGEAWFAGMKFFVDENVLIPRPETEELVEWIVEDSRNTKPAIKPGNFLDIGSGSGCIPIALKKKLPQISVTSLDISADALQVAKRNAALLKTDINFLLFDFLNEEKWNDLPVYDSIVSNPPYIKQSERALMNKNVLDFEPNLALFVEDNDALLFYKKLARFGKKHLSEDSNIYVEINETLGKEVWDLFTNAGYRAELKQDLQGKDRMLKATIRSNV